MIEIVCVEVLATVILSNNYQQEGLLNKQGFNKQVCGVSLCLFLRICFWFVLVCWITPNQIKSIEKRSFISYV